MPKAKAKLFQITPEGTIVFFTGARDSKAATERAPEGTITVKAAADLAQLGMAKIVELYNSAQTEDGEKVTKFPSKDKGAEQLFPLLDKIAQPGTVPPKPEKVKGEKKVGGRPSAVAGKAIFKNQAENPRRKDTHGGKAWDLITDGMLVSDFIKKADEAGIGGGGLKHLRYDVAKNRLRLEDPKAAK